MENSISHRIKKHRDELRAAGFRPIQIWVPDTRRQDFTDKCRQQSLALRNDPHETEILNWLQEASDTEGWK
ncbi:Uncharacterized protein MCB1EB_1731 [Mycoavidus cysteinexigens]|uniref:Uncharacterized protein n=1 Tax=Mycoavidus cysteinexigens TaxID=1553431 RepID=A0A2Z6EWX4_9BURK|nr:antitoxin MazE family protein [Mycoavidus cysteinexigens]BBE09892.1 Uncharacterized protein MCB1EB_1731 [Mycoavidus cysteinexigens]GAM53763.1 hypothetical protein EBME_2226 [bacterium endosymbiont of Mortierella elongata FMR23-6]GLR00332.1 hypothetical protein GCM10007934_01430 [Mycoavidus cysteinexigens]